MPPVLHAAKAGDKTVCVIERCSELCRGTPQRIVLPDSLDGRALAAAARLKREGLGRPVLVGNPMLLRKTAREAGDPLIGICCVDPEQPEVLAQNAEDIMRISEQKKRPVAKEDALALAKLPLVAGSLMLRRDEADLGIAGNLSSTADVLRTGLRFIGTAPGTKTVFSVFFLIPPDEQQVFVFADCAVIPTPTPEQLADVSIGSAKALRDIMGKEPRVALLSFSSKGSAEHPCITRVREALDIVKARDPQLVVDGELQFDAAISPEVAVRKAPESPVGGRANVFIFPSMEAGNIAYKIAQRLGGYTALGPFLIGFDKGWHDLSRGCSADDIYKISLVGTGLMLPRSRKTQ
jgi:Phosphotransacetylase